MPEAVLPIDPRSVAAARGLVLKALDGQSATSTDDAVLMISELVTNAVRHAHTWLHVAISVVDHTLRVEVSDDDATLPRTPDRGHDATSGRGLRIVDELADQWGVTSGVHGKTVWFEIRRRAPNPEP